MLDEEPTYDYDLTDADVVEEDVPQDLLTADEARQATSDHDHEVAVATAQEVIRQRGILMKDLETALNMCRRYRGVLRDNYFPDPNAAGLEVLLQKYGMTGAQAVPKRDFSPQDQERIAALTVGIKSALPPVGDGVAHATRELTSGG